MQNTDKLKLKRQMEQEAKQLVQLDGTDLAVSLLATCNALLRMAERAIPENSDAEITDEVYANYLSFAVRVNRFYQLHAEQGGDADVRINDELQKVLREIQSRKEETASLQLQYDAALAANKELKTRTDQLQKDLEEQLKVKEGLDKMYEEYSPEKTEEQKRKNDELFSALTRQKTSLEALREQCRKYEEDRENVTGELCDIEKKIADIPEEIVLLRDRYKEAETVLSELQNAETEYSPEKQQELQEKINALTPVVEENRVAAEVLGNRLESLRQQQTQYDEERHVLSTNLVELISSSMDDLKRYLKGQEEYLDETEKTADALAESLIRCQERYEEYSNWYEASKTPLEVMIDGLKYPESADLRKTLDVGQLPDIKKKFEDIRQGLRDIDYILAGCSAAAQKDLQRVRNRAER